MRRRKIDAKYMPYLLGMAVGYGITLLISIAAAVILSFSDAAARSAGAASVLALSVGSFMCGRTAGIIRHREGMRTGALCGLIFSAAPMALSLIFGYYGSVMLFVKPLLCVFFATAGGIAGVNKDEG